jgi:uncharacterized protein
VLRTAVSDERFAEATNLIARYPEHPLRTLDALHLTVAADAAASMGFQVARF